MSQQSADRVRVAPADGRLPCLNQDVHHGVQAKPVGDAGSVRAPGEPRGRGKQKQAEEELTQQTGREEVRLAEEV